MENLETLQELGIIKVNDDKSIELTEKGIFLVYTHGIFVASEIFIKIYEMIKKWDFKNENIEKELEQMK